MKTYKPKCEAYDEKTELECGKPAMALVQLKGTAWEPRPVCKACRDELVGCGDYVAYKLTIRVGGA